MNHWRDDLKRILKEFLATNDNIEHLDFLKRQIENGASSFSIITQYERLTKSIPVNWCPRRRKSLPARTDKLNCTNWIIEHLSRRDQRIWSVVTQHKINEDSYCRRPISEFKCIYGGTECAGALVAWISKDPLDAHIACTHFCTPREESSYQDSSLDCEKIGESRLGEEYLSNLPSQENLKDPINSFSPQKTSKSSSSLDMIVNTKGSTENTVIPDNNDKTYGNSPPSKRSKFV